MTDEVTRHVKRVLRDLKLSVRGKLLATTRNSLRPTVRQCTCTRLERPLPKICSEPRGDDRILGRGARSSVLRSTLILIGSREGVCNRVYPVRSWRRSMSECRVDFWFHSGFLFLRELISACRSRRPVSSPIPAQTLRLQTLFAFSFHFPLHKNHFGRAARLWKQKAMMLKLLHPVSIDCRSKRAYLRLRRCRLPVILYFLGACKITDLSVFENVANFSSLCKRFAVKTSSHDPCSKSRDTHF